MVARILHGPALSSEVPKKSVGQFYFDQADIHGDKVFQVDADRDLEESYKSIKMRSVRAAIELQKRGINSNDTVLLLSGNTLDTVVPILGAFYLGTTVAAVATNMAPREIKHLISLVEPRMIFVDEATLPVLERVLEGSGMKTEVIVFGETEKYCAFKDFQKQCVEESQFRPADVDLDDTIYVFFSSGTTGLSKAIEVNHRSYLHIGYVFGQIKCSFQSYLSLSTFQWVTATFALLTAYINGGQRVFSSGGAAAEPFFRAVEKYKITFTMCPNFQIQPLVEFKDAHKYNASSLTCILVGGNRISAKQLESMQNLFRHAKVINGYGMSEVGQVSDFDLENDAVFIKTKTASSGRPSAGVSLRITDPDTQEMLGPNEKGEICVKTLAMMKGYKDIDNAAVLTEDGFFRTGDIGYYDEDGCIYIVERLKDMFNYRNCRIVPCALEEVLLEHPEIEAAAVVGIPGEDLGDLPAAGVVLKKNSKLTPEQIDEWFTQRVIDGERLRGGVRILDRIPRTATGKVLKRQLRDQYFTYACKN